MPGEELVEELSSSPVEPTSEIDETVRDETAAALAQPASESLKARAGDGDAATGDPEQEPESVGVVAGNGSQEELESVVEAAIAPLRARLEALKAVAQFSGQEEKVAQLAEAIIEKEKSVREAYEKERQEIETLRTQIIGRAADFLASAEESNGYSSVLHAEAKGGKMTVFIDQEMPIAVSPEVFETIVSDLYTLVGASRPDSELADAKKTQMGVKSYGEETGVEVTEWRYHDNAHQDAPGPLQKVEMSYEELKR